MSDTRSVFDLLERYETIPQICERIGCSRSTVERRIYRHQLVPADRLGTTKTAQLLFDPEDVDRVFADWL